MDQLALLAIGAVVSALLTIVGLRALFAPFDLFHLRTNLPLVGRVARDARMSPPSKPKAEGRLDRLFRAYASRMGPRGSAEAFDRARDYLFLAGDSEVRPAPWYALVLLAGFLAADAASFSYQLGSRFNPDASEDVVAVIAGCFIALFVGLLASFGHIVGGSVRRTRTLRQLALHAIDPSRVVPGEKPSLDLTSRMSLDEDQDRDRPVWQPNDAQRTLNRLIKVVGDRGSYVPAVAYTGLIGALAYAQYHLRTLSGLAANAIGAFDADLSSALAAVAPADDGASVANATFCIVFVATQVYAVRTGFKHTFVGVDSKRAYERLKGADQHSEIAAAYDRKVRKADETLSSLISAYKRYTGLGALDEALFQERVDRERAAAPRRDGGDPAPPAEPGASNVAQFPVLEGAK